MFSSDINVVDFSFWIVTASMAAATLFFILERFEVNPKWRTSLTVAALITGIAFWHYLRMSSVWIDTGTSPTVYRYIDWFITVPLQIVEFYLILVAVTVVKARLFWQLLVASLVMLIGGFYGEANIGSDSKEIIGFVVGMAGWAYIMYLIFFGDAKEANDSSGNPAGQLAFKALRYIVTIGWAIYSIGYLLVYIIGDSPFGEGDLNLIYNLADLVNKIAFGLVIWYAATTDKGSVVSAAASVAKKAVSSTKKRSTTRKSSARRTTSRRRS